MFPGMLPMRQYYKLAYTEMVDLFVYPTRMWKYPVRQWWEKIVISTSAFQSCFQINKLETTSFEITRKYFLRMVSVPEPEGVSGDNEHCWVPKTRHWNLSSHGKGQTVSSDDCEPCWVPIRPHNLTVWAKAAFLFKITTFSLISIKCQVLW